MRELRIHASLRVQAGEAAWAVHESGQPIRRGEAGSPLPLPADRIVLVLPAAEVLFRSVTLPPGAARRGDGVLAFAVEDDLVGEPDRELVLRVGERGDKLILAVLDRAGLERWRQYLTAAGAGSVEVTSETLLLPWTQGRWSMAWDGAEGYVRTGEIEGAATDGGDRLTPPLWLRQALHGQEHLRPDSIEVHPCASGSAPDAEAWSRALGVTVRVVSAWDWREQPLGSVPTLMRFGARWRGVANLATRLRPAAWIAAGALLVHGVLSLADWARLAALQNELRAAQEARFRATFPDAVAVADPMLQMRRKLAEARHAAGKPDERDFRPLLERAAQGLAGLAPGSLRAISYEAGRLTFELSPIERALQAQVVTRLEHAGFAVDPIPPAAAGAPPRNVFISARLP